MQKSVKKNFQKFGLSNKVRTARIRLIRPGKPAPNVCKNACHEKTMIQFPKVNAKGAFTCQIPIILKASSFCVSIRCWKKYPSVAVPGGRDVNPGVTQNLSNSAPAQQHGVCRILTSCSKKSTHRKRNGKFQCPCTSSVTARNVPEAATLSRPSPTGRIRGP